MKRVLIVGGVAAGATAAAKLRRMDADIQITMLEAGRDISFANCGLPYYIGRDIDSRSKLLLQSPESFKEQYNVEAVTNITVTKIDRQAHQLTAKDSQTNEEKILAYDKLILAQGGKPLVPQMPGVNQEHVFTLWTLSDMDAIDSFIEKQKPQTAVVVGGGFIGLEMVEALSKRGIAVKVVEAMPHAMPVLEAEISAFIENEMLAYGVEIYTNISVKEIKKDTVQLANDHLLSADMVLLSIGVRPTLELAQQAGLQLGEAGGLLVNEFLQTSDPDIYAAGDMVEIDHRILNKKVRIPLAGPANRQGRIAAENVLGNKHPYKGSLATSIVRVFEAVAGSTGLSLKQARAANIDASAIVVHKEHHTSYYPGAQNVTVMLVYQKSDGRILGGQVAGFAGADRRLDVIAMAVASEKTIHDLADVDFAYSPPLGTANDVLNMAAFVAQNTLSNFSPSVLAGDLNDFIKEKNPVFIDVRDVFAFDKSHIQTASHVPLEFLSQQLSQLPRERTIVVYDDTGKRGHMALRLLRGSGFDDVYNLSGGFISLQRYASAMGYQNLQVELLPIEPKSLEDKKEETTEAEVATENSSVAEESKTLVVDVRTVGEFLSGAVPDSINIPLDELNFRRDELGSNMDREIIVYCATGARSSYAQMLLEQMGYTNVSNGGGIMQMMMSRS